MLATEMFTVYQNTSPTIFSELFCRHDISYNLQSNPIFAVLIVKSGSMEAKVFPTEVRLCRILYLLS